MAAFDFKVFMLLLSLLSITTTHIDAFEALPFSFDDFSDLNRSCFPPDFVFGTASSAFQALTNNHLFNFCYYYLCNIQCRNIVVIEDLVLFNDEFYVFEFFVV
jgi:hypothetical protein